MHESLLDALEAELPASVLIDETMKTHVYAWRLTGDQQAKLFRLAAGELKPVEGEIDVTFINEALAMSLGDANGPCCDTPRGRAFIDRMPLNRRIEWGNKVLGLSEIYGPSDDRKKK
jgi:hypothetical protein